MTIKVDTNAAIKLITPATDVAWVKSKLTPTSETLTQTAGDTVSISGAGIATKIDYSTSLFDNDLTGNQAAKNVITGGSGADILNGGTLADLLTGGAGADELFGGADVDKLFGGDGADNLAGGAGDDLLTGGAGSDLFVVDAGTDKILDLSGADNLFAVAGATANVTTTAAWVADFATGNNGTINLVKNGFDVDVSKASGTNGFNISSKSAAALTLIGSKNADTITGGEGADTLIGNAGADILNGSKGDDSLNGGLGDDTLIGGKGNDTFTVASGTDTITDLGDSDALVISTIANATVGKKWIATAATNNTGTVNITAGGLVDLTLATGTQGFTVSSTAAKGISLIGSVLDDTLTGSAAGKDILNGGVGADTLTGGAGDDTYYVDNAGDSVVELDVANEKAGDSVYSSVNYTLTTNVENLMLTGSALLGTGNARDNKITGNVAGNNVLDGGIGADTLTGGAGNDTFKVDNIGDVVIDKLGGTDTVESSITYTLGKTIENLTLTGGFTDAIDGTGNKLDNILIGNLGNNTLNGGEGIDTISGGEGLDKIIGGKGNDILTGNDGIDTFLYDTKAAGLDTITDFNTGIDILQFATGALKGLTAGQVASTGFISVAGVVAATTAAQHFIFNTTTGALYYDADGSAAKAAPVQIEVVGLNSNAADLHASDIWGV